MVEVLLSDIDGTLVDSNALHAEAWRRAFEHFGIQVGMDEAWRQIGKGGDNLIPVFVPKAGSGSPGRAAKEFPKKAIRPFVHAASFEFPQITGIACSS